MQNSTKFIYATLLALFASSLLAAETVDQTVDAQLDGTVLINVVRGKVKIRSWQQPKVKVEGVLDSKTKQFIFNNEGNETVIKVKLKNNSSSWFGSDQESDLKIWLPVESAVDFVGVSAELEAQNLHRRIFASSVSGNIELKNSSNKASLRTVSGDIDVDDYDGKIELASVSGDINANTNSRYFKAQSVSGEIEANIGDADTVDLVSVSGNIDTVLSLGKDGSLQSNTVSGNVNLKFKNDRLNSCFQINSGISGNVVNRLKNVNVNQSRNSNKHINFSVGKPSADVNIQTMSGTITLEND